jgi:hypothetical protein
MANISLERKRHFTLTRCVAQNSNSTGAPSPISYDDLETIIGPDVNPEFLVSGSNRRGKRAPDIFQVGANRAVHSRGSE